jgi:hypothetical protein
VSHDLTIGLEPGSWMRGRLDGEPVARARVKNSPIDWGLGTVVPAAGIGGVRTEEGYRKRGFASQVMRKAMEEGLARGCPVGCVSTECHNTARRLYTRLGYTYLFAVELWEKDAGRPDPAPAPAGVTVRLFAAGDERDIETLWYERYSGAGYFGEICKPPAGWFPQRELQIEEDPASVWVAERDGSIVGWAEYYIKWGTHQHAMFQVKEGPDAREISLALLTRVERAASERGLRVLRFDATRHQPGVLRAVRDLGCRRIEGFVFHVALLDLPGLLGHLKPLFEKRLDTGNAGAHPAVLRVEAGGMTGEIELAGGEPGRELALSADRDTMTRVLCGRIGAWEAYRRGVLDVRGSFDERRTPCLDTFLGGCPWFHPMRYRD